MTERDLEQSMKIDIKLDVFEGPLDLLLHLIEKNKVSIYDIPIVEITNQYMEYIREMEKTYSMESMSEFLVMAATLLKIKSKMLLPQPEKEEEEEKYRGAKPKKEDACGAHTTQKRFCVVNVSASGHAHASHLFTKLEELAFGSQSRDHSPTVALEYTGNCGGIPTS